MRLPKSCRFPEDQQEVLVRRVGRRVIIEPTDEWPEEFVRCLGAWRGTIPRPSSKAVTDLEDPFE